MLRVRIQKGVASPVIICDACMERIYEPQAAIAVFNNSAGTLLSEVWHLHKGHCDSEFTARLNKNGIITAWHDLVAHFLYLVSNTGLPPAELLEESKKSREVRYEE